MPNGRPVTPRRARRGPWGRSGAGRIGLLAAIATLAAACAAPPPSVDPQSLEELSLGVLVPLTGEQAESGVGALAAVEAVVAERAADLAAAGATLRVVPLDDRGLQGVGQQQATVLADDPQVIAVIGSTDSSIDEGVQPILADADVPQLSLGGSAPLLVQRTEGGVGFPTYATYAARPEDRGQVAGALVEPGDRVAILVGPRREDRVLARAFRAAAERAGGRAVLIRTVGNQASGPGDPVARAGLRSALDAVAADVVYAPVEPTRTWEVVADVRTVEPGATLLLDESALGRWSEALDQERAEAERRGVRWGPIRAVTTGYGAASVPAPTEATSGEDLAADPADAQVGRFATAARDATSRILDAALRPAPGAIGDAGMIRERIVAEYPEVVEGSLGEYRMLDPGIASRRLVGVYARGADRWRPLEGYVVIGRCPGQVPCAIRPGGR